MLFYLSPKGSQVPITAIKAITKRGVILLTGTLIEDSDPKFENRHGTEDLALSAVYESVNKLVTENTKAIQDVRDSHRRSMSDLSDLMSELKSVTSKVIKQAENCTTKATDCANKTTQVLDTAMAGSAEVRKLMEQLNGYLGEFETAIAENHSL